MIQTSKFRFVRFAAAALAVAGVFSAGRARADGAQQGQSRDARSSAMSVSRITRALALTDEQAEKVKAIYESRKAERSARSQNLRSAHESLQKVTNAIPSDEQAIRNAAQALGQAEAESALLEAKIRAQIAQILNPDQQQKLASYHEGGGMMGMGRGRFLFRGND